MKTYSKVSDIPSGSCTASPTAGTLVLEGGAWRGIYTQGALDVLMEQGILFDTTIGCSAGAMAAIGYMSGQIGWAPRINLSHRHDPEYCGRGAMKRDHGITGFSYLFHELMEEYPFDRDRFNDPSRRLYVVATDIDSGQPVFFEKQDRCIFKAIRASATVPYVSRPVVIRGHAYLDGGLSVKIPYAFAKGLNPRALMVIRTQDRSYRKGEKPLTALDRLLYGSRPELLDSMVRANTLYNETIEEMEADEAKGRTFVLTPSRPVGISRFEGDMEKLGQLYELGRDDMNRRMPELLAYLRNREDT